MNRYLAPLAPLILVLAIPSIAGAAVRCVPAGGPGCDSSHGTINLAVAAASNGDEIRIAAGNYPESVTTAKRLDFVGAGEGTLDSAAGATVIQPAIGTPLNLQSGGSVRSLRAVGASGFSGANAINLFPPANGSYTYIVDDVIGLGGAGTDITFGFGGVGLLSSGADAGKIIQLEVEDSVFRGGVSAGISPGQGTSIFGPAMTATISRSTMLSPTSGNAAGMSAGNEARVTVVDSTTRGSFAGAVLQEGTFEFRRSRSEGAGGPLGVGYGMLITDGTNTSPTSLDLVSSLVSSTTELAAVDSYGLLVQTASTSGAVNASIRGSTIIGGGADPEAAVNAKRLTAGSPPSTVDLRNSVALLTGGAEAGEGDLLADRGTILAGHSSFTSVTTVNGGTAPTVGSVSNVAGDPQLDAAFAPLASSPLVDSGDPAIVNPGELDLVGNPRSADGDGDCEEKPDIGAFERPSACPPEPDSDATPSATNEPPVITRLKLVRKGFTSRKPRRKGRRRGTAFLFDLSEDARVAVSIQRRAAGRRVVRKGKRRCVKPTRRNRSRPRCRRWRKAGVILRQGRAGRNRVPFFGRVGRRKRPLPPGRYRAILVAIDSEGLRSDPRRIGFRVLRP